MTMTHPPILVPVSRLTLAPQNVRKSYSGEADTQLKASIAARGVLQNLVGLAVPRRRGHFSIIAGGRRLRAVQALIAEGSVHTVCTYGEAMDSADKATNKAMSAAYKYAAFQTFCIPTEGDNDADATTPEATKVVVKKEEPVVNETVSAEDLPQDYFALLDELEATESKEDLRRWALNTTARRAALPKVAQSKLRELTIEHQNSIKQAQLAAA